MEGMPGADQERQTSCSVFLGVLLWPKAESSLLLGLLALLGWWTLLLALGRRLANLLGLLRWGAALLWGSTLLGWRAALLWGSTLLGWGAALLWWGTLLLLLLRHS